MENNAVQSPSERSQHGMIGAHQSSADTENRSARTLPDLVGYDGASEILGVPVNTLKDWRAKGRAPRSAVIAGHVRYRVADLLDWLDQQFDQDHQQSTGPALEPLGHRRKMTSL